MATPTIKPIAQHDKAIVNAPQWMGLAGNDVKLLILAHFCTPTQQIDNDKLARLANLKPRSAQEGFKRAKRSVWRLFAADPSFMQALTQQPFADERSTAEPSESEIDETRSKGHHQNDKRKDYAKRKGKGKSVSLDSESEDIENSEIEDESSPVNFNPASKTQRRNTKQKTTKHNKHNKHSKHSTTNGMRKGRDSPLYAGINLSSSRARYQKDERNRGVKRGRNQYAYQDDSTAESADESSSEEMNATSSRTSHGKAKRKRLGDLGKLDDTSDNDSDMEEEVKGRPARAYAKSASVKAKSQNGNRNKVSKTNGVAESPDKDVVGGAMDGLTLEGDAPKTNGHATARTAKGKHDERAGSIHEENKESKEPDEAHV
ncbi:unnamed protein product [Penicillium discolor]